MNKIFSIASTFFIISFVFCSKSIDFEAEKVHNYNKAKFFPEEIDTTGFDIFNYFDERFIERFIYEINLFEKSDNKDFPEFGQILFVGSSSIRMWKTVKEDMQPYEVINRGFGGATIPELIYYSDKIVFPYKPAKVVFYCGENDHDWNFSVQICQTFQYFEKIFHAKLPESELFFVSVKPSPSRKHWWKRICMTNRFIENYCEMKEHTTFIDVASSMFNDDYTINKEIFIQDNLHLNSDGYNIWTSIIKPYLE